MDRGKKKTKEGILGRKDTERRSKEETPRDRKRQKVSDTTKQPSDPQEEEKYPINSLEEEKEPKQKNMSSNNPPPVGITMQDMGIEQINFPNLEMPDLPDDQVDFGTFEPMLYPIEQDEDSEGEEAIHEIEGEIPEGEEIDIDKLPEEDQRNIAQDLQSLGVNRIMQGSHPPMPQRFRPTQMTRALRRMAERCSRGRGRGRNRRRTDENSIKFDNLFTQLQTQNIDELKNNIAILNTEI